VQTFFHISYNDTAHVSGLKTRIGAVLRKGFFTVASHLVMCIWDTLTAVNGPLSTLFDWTSFKTFGIWGWRPAMTQWTTFWKQSSSWQLKQPPTAPKTIGANACLKLYPDFSCYT